MELGIYDKIFQRCDMMIRYLVKGLHHVSMKCSSIEEYEKTVDFYKNIIGIPVARTWEAGIMLDACAEAVKKAGYEVSIEPKNIEIASLPAFPARIAFCKGPLGEEIEFFQETTV